MGGREEQTDPTRCRDDLHAARGRQGNAKTGDRSTGKVAEHPFVMFAVVAVVLTMSTLDNTIVATALDALQHGLQTSIPLAGWTITAYSLGMVLTLSLASELTGRFGPRRVFLWSVSLFTAASLCCGLVNNIYVLIVLRFVQAVGGAGFTPSATRIVVEHFGSARDKALGLFGSLFTVGGLIGPVLGGIIVASWSWRGVFLVNVPIGLALIPLCLRYVPTDIASERSGGKTIDVMGVALLGVGLLATMIGVTYLGDQPTGWIAPCVVALVVASLGLWSFMRHIEGADEPLIAPNLIYGRGFGAVNVINVLYSGASVGLVALVPLYAINRYAFDVVDSGTLLATEAAGAVIMSTVGSFILRRTGYRLPLYSAAVIAGVGMMILAVPPMIASTYAWLAIGAGLVGAGIGYSNPASRNAGLQLVPDKASSIAALRSTGIQIGSIVAVSVTTAIVAHAGDAGVTQAWIFVVYAGLLVLIGLPATAHIPEHKGGW
ncbi:MAG TPA: MFS transporter [Nevskiaceae bacterium]|nr:MFS transporter [Nevskiaceae bacterium]